MPMLSALQTPHNSMSIAAFAAAAKEQPEAHLDFFSDGPLFAECRDYVAANALQTKSHCMV
jgi:hypothetical protein